MTILSGFECQFFILSSWMSWLGWLSHYSYFFSFLIWTYYTRKKYKKNITWQMYKYCTKSNGNSIEFFLLTWTWSRFKSSQARTLHLAQNCRNKKGEEKGKLIPQNKFEVLSSKIMRCEVRRTYKMTRNREKGREGGIMFQVLRKEELQVGVSQHWGRKEKV